MKIKTIGNAPFSVGLPEGYRWLEVGERTEYGDLFPGDTDWTKTIHPDRRVTKLLKRFYIRKR